MRTYHSARNIFLSIIAFLIMGTLVACQPSGTTSLEEQVEGLWFYTGLTSSGGDEMPLTGVFLFKNDIFVQHAVFNGEPIAEQGSMAHAGPYSVGPEYVHLVAEQTISVAPSESAPLSSAGLTEHDVTAERSGNDLTLIFSKGTGTVQNFEYVGPGEGEVYSIANGAFALVDGHFVLVEGSDSGSTAGYGTFDKDGDNLKLNIIRWTDADRSAASNLAGTSMSATFDGQTLNLENGRSFSVKP